MADYKCPQCNALLTEVSLAAWNFSRCSECNCRIQMVGTEGADPMGIIPQWLPEETVECNAGLGAFVGEAGGASNQAYCEVFHRNGCVETPIVEAPPTPAPYYDGCG